MFTTVFIGNSQSDFLESFIVRTVFGYGTDAHIRVYLPPSFFEPLDFLFAVMLGIDNDIIIGLDLFQTPDMGSDKDTSLLFFCSIYCFYRRHNFPDQNRRCHQQHHSPEDSDLDFLFHSYLQTQK